MIFEKLKAMIVNQLGVDASSVTLESNIFDDIGADSLDIVEMLMDVESEWNITVDDSEVLNVKTVGDVVKLVESKLAKLVFPRIMPHIYIWLRLGGSILRAFYLAGRIVGYRERRLCRGSALSPCVLSLRRLCRVFLFVKFVRGGKIRLILA